MENIRTEEWGGGDSSGQDFEFLTRQNQIRRDTLRRALNKDQMFFLKTDPQFEDPAENKAGTYISQYEAIAMLEKYQNGVLETNKRQDGDSPTTQQNDDDVPLLSAPNMDNDDEWMADDGIALDQDEYLRLSQYVGGQDPFQKDESGNAYNSVLFEALAHQRVQDRSNDMQRRYKAIVQNLVRPAPESPDVVASKIQSQSQKTVPSSVPFLYKNGKQQQQQQPIAAEAPTASVNDLLRAWQGATASKNRTSEELHQQVFAEEEGFLKQSKLFRESLSNSSKTREAMASRHAAAYQVRQTTAQAKLQKQIQEMEQLLQSNPLPKCPLCKCIMSQDSWNRTKKDYRGMTICDICYAEKRFVKHRSFIETPPPLKPSLFGSASASSRTAPMGSSSNPVLSHSRQQQLARPDRGTGRDDNEEEEEDDDDDHTKSLAASTRDVSQAPGMPGATFSFKKYSNDMNGTMSNGDLPNKETLTTTNRTIKEKFFSKTQNAPNAVRMDQLKNDATITRRLDTTVVPISERRKTDQKPAFAGTSMSQGQIDNKAYETIPSNKNKRSDPRANALSNKAGGAIRATFKIAGNNTSGGSSSGSGGVWKKVIHTKTQQVGYFNQITGEFRIKRGQSSREGTPS